MLNKTKEIPQMFLIWMKYRNLHKVILKEVNNLWSRNSKHAYMREIQEKEL